VVLLLPMGLKTTFLAAVDFEAVVTERGVSAATGPNDTALAFVAWRTALERRAAPAFARK